MHNENIEVKISETHKVNRLFLLFPFLGILLFIVFKYPVLLIFSFGIYIPHFVTFLLILMILPVVYFANAIYIIFKGKPSRKPYTFIKDFFYFFLYLEIGLLYLTGGYAPFFKQDDFEFGAKISLNACEKFSRIHAVFRLTGISILLTLPLIIITAFISVLFVIFTIINFPYILIKEKVPVFLIKKAEKFFFYFASLIAYNLGLTDDFLMFYMKKNKAQNT